MFYHPLFREWLIRRRDNESTKFMVDPRNGHLAIALTYSRGNAGNSSCNSNGNSTNSSCNSSSPPAIELNAEKILDLCHHMLKAHVYRNHQNSKSLQSTWLCQIADQVINYINTLLFFLQTFERDPNRSLKLHWFLRYYLWYFLCSPLLISYL